MNSKYITNRQGRVGNKPSYVHITNNNVQIKGTIIKSYVWFKSARIIKR